MGREPTLYVDLLERLRSRAAHPVRTLALLIGLALISTLIGAASPMPSSPGGSASGSASAYSGDALCAPPQQVCGPPQMP